MQHRRPLAKVVAGLATAVVLGACTSAAGSGARTTSGGSGNQGSQSNSSGGSGPSVVSPASARQVIAPTMAKNNRANVALSSSLLGSYEGGSAFALDNATYAADRVAKYHPPASPFTVDVRSVAVARQATWPATFLALGTQRSLVKNGPAVPSCGTALLFQRTSRSGPWRIVLEPSLAAGELPQPAFDAGGFVSNVPVGRIRRADALPSEFVKALFAEETSGRLGPFRRSDFTGRCWELPNPRLDVVNAENDGFNQRDLFSKASRPDTAAVPLRGGSTLVMFTLSFEDQLLETAADRPIPWAHPSVSKQPAAAWTYFLGAGNYSEVVERGDLEVAVELSPSGRSWRTVGAYFGVMSVTGHRTTGSPSPPSSTVLSAMYQRR